MNDPGISTERLKNVDGTDWAPGQRAYVDETGRNAQTGLTQQALTWSGPKASDPEKAGPNMRGSKGDQPLPAQAAKWPSPMAGAGEKITLASHQDSLLKQAHDFAPPSSPDHPTIAGGSTSSTAGPNSNQPSVKRKLNPIFVEALMRWPTGLSGFARAETALIQWRQQQLIFLSMLCSQRMPEQGRLL